MNYSFNGLKFLACSALIALSKFRPAVMDNSVPSHVTKLLSRLSDAERRAKLLQLEIQDIRTQIASLTQSTNSILANRASTVLLSKAVTPQKRSIEEPDAFDGNQAKRAKGVPPIENEYVVVYTDGACEHNGKPNAKAGIGVWFSDGNPMNISEPVVGRATNNTAEIQAPIQALKLLKSQGFTKVKILTDSQFTINCITKWIHRWKKNQWKLAKGGSVKNKEDLVQLDAICQQFVDVKWEYCEGHRGIKGNEEADKLARKGAARYVS